MSTPREMDFPTFVHQRIMVHIVLCTPKELHRACALYGVDLEQFKKDHSEEITFELLRK